MSGSDDINNLFARFGGHPDHYQELERASAARDSEARWPLLSALNGHPARPATSAAAPAGAEPGPAAGRPPERTEPVLNLREAAGPAEAPAAVGMPWSGQAPAAAGPAASAATPEGGSAATASPRFQFIAPRPRGLMPAAPARAPEPEPTHSAAAAGAAMPAAPEPPPASAQPAGSGLPFGAPAFAAPPTQARTVPSWSRPAAPAPAPASQATAGLRYPPPPSADPAPAAPAVGAPAAGSPFSAFRQAAAPAQPQAAPPADAGGDSRTLANVFQRLAQPAHSSPAAAPRGFFQRLVNR